jgi:hypothetical protein
MPLLQNRSNCAFRCGFPCLVTIPTAKYGFNPTIFDVFVKSPICPLFVIPAKAGIQLFQVVMDSRFCGSDSIFEFLRSIISHNQIFKVIKPKEKSNYAKQKSKKDS